MGMTAILLDYAELFEKIIANTPMWNLVKTGQAVSKTKTFKVNTILYVYNPGTGTDNSLGDKSL